TKISGAISGNKKTLRLSERTTARHRERRDRLRIVGSLPRDLRARGRWETGAGLSRFAFPEARETQRGRSRAGGARHDREQRPEIDDRRVAARAGRDGRLSRSVLRIGGARERAPSHGLDSASARVSARGRTGHGAFLAAEQ